MFSLALIIGIYSYSIFLIGLLFLLKPSIIVLFSILFFTALMLLYSRSFQVSKFYIKIKKVRLKKLDKFLLVILGAQIGINLIGALGPELAFDALWYHLTIPKIYLEYEGIIHIPGGLLYYFGIPKLTELIYTAQLAFGSEILPKLTHFFFGILTSIALFKISKRYLGTTYSLLAVLLFYSNLVVAWESITAYVDLTRAFFEIMALWAFVIWQKKGNMKWFLLSSVILGLAISSKLISILTVPIYLILIFIQEVSLSKKIKLSVLFVALSLFIVLPWLAFSFTHTGNPIYPLLTNYETGQNLSLLNPINFLRNLFLLFTHSPDPISPFYIIIFPLIIIFAKKIYKSNLSLILIYSLISLFAWYLMPHPQTAGGRYIISYLPALSLLSVGTLFILKNTMIKNYLIAVIIFLSIISFTYRGVANFRYVPVLLGAQTKEDFMKKNLNFSFGDFYDIDNYFKNNLKKDDAVLLYGFHNLYYVNFNFIHESWVKKGDKFNFIATQNANLPNRFSFWKLVYYNPTTSVRLYSIGGEGWTY